MQTPLVGRYHQENCPVAVCFRYLLIDRVSFSGSGSCTQPFCDLCWCLQFAQRSENPTAETRAVVARASAIKFRWQVLLTMITNGERLRLDKDHYTTLVCSDP